MTEEYLKKEITRLKKEIEKQPMSANEKRIRNRRKAWVEYYENELKKIKGVDK
jgi:retron-type reverse transcriptase